MAFDLSGDYVSIATSEEVIIISNSKLLSYSYYRLPVTPMAMIKK